MCSLPKLDKAEHLRQPAGMCSIQGCSQGNVMTRSVCYCVVLCLCMDDSAVASRFI